MPAGFVLGHRGASIAAARKVIPEHYAIASGPTGLLAPAGRGYNPRVKFAYDPSAEIVVAVIGAAFAAFCIFMIIRIISRGRWPGWRFWGTAVIAALAAYPLSLGPVTWLLFHDQLPEWADVPLGYLYKPLYESPKPIHDALAWYDRLWKPSLVPDESAPVPLSPEEIRALEDEWRKRCQQ